MWLTWHGLYSYRQRHASSQLVKMLWTDRAQPSGSTTIFFTTISKLTKEIFVKICLQFNSPTRTWKCRRCIIQMTTCSRQSFLSRTFASSLNMQKQYEQNDWVKSDDMYSLSMRVQTTINHISVCFLPQYQRQRKYSFSDRELQKALRDALKREAWYALLSTTAN